MSYQALTTEIEPTVFGRVAVLLGGSSSEREVSLQGGQAIYHALRSAKVDAFMIDIQQDFPSQLQAESFDRAFIALHGGDGEGGLVQAFLQAMGKPFTGSCYAASALCMDKITSKRVWQAIGLPTLPFEVLSAPHCQLPYPLAVKPNCEGSTFGISRANNVAEFRQAFDLANQYQGPVFVEPWLEGMEYTVTILNGQSLPSIRIEPKSGFYDYEAKYLSDDTGFFCPSGLSNSEEKALQQLCLEAYQVLGGKGWGRIDCIRDDNGQFWLFEANTVPGLTSHSLVPLAAQHIGLNYQELALEILATSLSSQEISVKLAELV